MAHKAKRQPDPSTYDHTEYQCALCEFSGLTGKSLLDHLTTHGYTADEARTATGKLSLHLDGSDWFQTTYEVTIAGNRVGYKLARRGRRTHTHGQT